MTDLVSTDAYAAPGNEAKHEYGVLYQGEFETPWDGTGAAVRLNARALAAQGVPVLLRSFSNTVINANGLAEPVHIAGIPEEVTAEVGHLLDTSIRSCVPAIKHVVVRSAEHLRQVIMPRGAIPEHDDVESLIKLKNRVYGNTILYTVWERDRVDAEIAKHLSRVAEVWVPCQQNAAMLIANGVMNVFVVPHPYEPKSDICKLVKRPQHRDGVAKFYSIGRWEPRKGFAELITAFVQAFAPDCAATLTIKYSGSGIWKDYPTPDEAIESAVNAVSRRAHSEAWTVELVRKKIKLIDGKLPRSRVVELHYRNTIYVSASHGEAWNLPAWDAKLAGNYMVHVPWGGTSDFRDVNDVSVPYQLGPVHSSYSWESNARWADYNVNDLAAALRFAAKEYWGNAPWAVRPFHPIGIEDRFSLDAVGKLMLERIHHLTGGSVKYGTDDVR